MYNLLCGRGSGFWRLSSLRTNEIDSWLSTRGHAQDLLTTDNHTKCESRTFYLNSVSVAVKKNYHSRRSALEPPKKEKRTARRDLGLLPGNRLVADGRLVPVDRGACFFSLTYLPQISRGQSFDSTRPSTGCFPGPPPEVCVGR
jgi:hypothetical protein